MNEQPAVTNDVMHDPNTAVAIHLVPNVATIRVATNSPPAVTSIANINRRSHDQSGSNIRQSGDREQSDVRKRLQSA